MSISTGDRADPAVIALRAIWAARRDEVIARVDVIEEAITDALIGDLGDDVRGRAAQEAHRLAGSAGSFGFAAASSYAREIELALKVGAPRAPDQLQRLAQLVVDLRHDLESDLPESDDEPGSTKPALQSGERQGKGEGEGEGEGKGNGNGNGKGKGVDVLVLAMEPGRGRRVATETAARGLVAAFAVDAEDAQRALDSTPPPGVIVLEATGAKSLELLERAAAKAPTIVLAAPGAVDRVEVARRGGRGLLDCQSTIVQIVDAAVGLRDRLRSAGTTVLAVDDDLVLLDLLGSVLSAADLRVETCADPARSGTGSARWRPIWSSWTTTCRGSWDPTWRNRCATTPATRPCRSSS